MASRSTRLVPVLVFACALLAVHELYGQSPTQLPTPQRIESGFGQGAYRAQPGMREPHVLRRVEASYPIDAIQARAKGEVVLEVVVLPDGSVGPVRVVKAPLPAFGLDEAAINAARKWLFLPGTLGGKPVPMVVTVVQEFTHGQPPPPQWPYWVPDAEFLKGVGLIGQRGVTMPVLERSVEPKYTSEAMRAKLMGTVTVDLVVGPDGTVLRSRIARSLDPTFGLDRMALEAASQWQFKPGLVNGQPAHVLVTATLEFRLH